MTTRSPAGHSCSTAISGSTERDSSSPHQSHPPVHPGSVMIAICTQEPHLESHGNGTFFPESGCWLCCLVNTQMRGVTISSLKAHRTTLVEPWARHTEAIPELLPKTFEATTPLTAVCKCVSNTSSSPMPALLNCFETSLKFFRYKSAALYSLIRFPTHFPESFRVPFRKTDTGISVIWCWMALKTHWMNWKLNFSSMLIERQQNN